MNEEMRELVKKMSVEDMEKFKDYKLIDAYRFCQEKGLNLVIDVPDSIEILKKKY